MFSEYTVDMLYIGSSSCNSRTTEWVSQSNCRRL